MNDHLTTKIAAIASNTKKAQKAYKELQALYKFVAVEHAKIIIALGGDGFMLETMHRFYNQNVMIYGMNLGTVGFLMNRYQKDNLIERLSEATVVELHPLIMQCQTTNHEMFSAIALNEVALRRQTRQTAKIKVWVDGIVRLEELVADGILLSTAAGSTAYNLSAQGPIIPLDSNLLALTPICAFRPRRWKGALLPHTSEIVWEALDPETRPVCVEADFTEILNVHRVCIKEDRTQAVKLMFDPDHHLEERLIQEQFLP